MAIKEACLTGNSLKNTGKECDVAMVATAMFIAVPPTLKITLDDLEDPIAWITPLLHASKQSRVYPFFGQQAPIRTIINNAESDVLVTLDDGLQVFLRYGIYNRLFETTSGGICYAKALQGLNKSGYRLIELDQSGQMLLHKNDDGTYGGLIIDFMYAPSPIMADFKTTPYKNRFQCSLSPVEFVQRAKIFTGAEAFLSLMGLLDAEITNEQAPTILASTPAVAPTGGTTEITDEGADGDDIQIDINGVDVSGTVAKTSSESTPDLLATKIADAVTAMTGSNGGITASAAGAIITYSIPDSFGATLNGIAPIANITGTITEDSTPFDGGTDLIASSAILHVGVKTECAKTDLVELFQEVIGDNATNFVITDKEDGTVITPDEAALNVNMVNLTGPFQSGHTYNVKGAEPSVWLENGIEGYDASDNGVDITIP